MHTKGPASTLRSGLRRGLLASVVAAVVLTGAWWLLSSLSNSLVPLYQQRAVEQLLLKPSVLGALGECHLDAIRTNRDRVSVFFDRPTTLRLELTPLDTALRPFATGPAMAASSPWSEAPPACVRTFAEAVVERAPPELWPALRGEREIPKIADVQLPPDLLILSDEHTIPFAAPAGALRVLPIESLRAALWWAFALLGWLIWLAPLAAPFLLALPGSSDRPRRLTGRAFEWGLTLAFFAWFFWVHHTRGLPVRWATVETQSYLDTAALCARGGECPIIGQPMGNLQVRLGPLFFQLLAPLLKAGLSFDRLMDVVDVAFAAAATLLAVLFNRLFGSPWGFFGTAVTALGVGATGFAMATPQHAAFIPLSLAGVAWGLTSWAAGGGGRALLLLVASLSAAVQLHGTALFLVPTVLLAGVVLRPPTPARALRSALALVAVVGLPWLVFNLAVSFRDFRLEGIRMPGSSSGAGTLWSSWMFGVRWEFVLLGLVGLLWRCRPKEEPSTRTAARAWLGLIAVVGAIYSATYRGWLVQYFFLFTPIVIALVAAGFSLVERATWGRLLRLPPLRFALSAGVAVYAATYWLPIGDHIGPRASDPNAGLRWREVAAVAQVIPKWVAPPSELQQVHGLHWRRFEVPRPWLASEHLAQLARPRSSAHLFVAVNCTALPSSFSTQQETLTVSERPITVAAYDSRLSGWQAALVEGERELWRGPLRLPVGDDEIPESFTPPERMHAEVFGAPQLWMRGRGTERIDAWLPDIWKANQSAVLRLRVEYERGPDARALVLTVPQAASFELRIGGDESASLLLDRHPVSTVELLTFRLPEGSEGERVPIELQLRYTPTPDGFGFPKDLDLYEAPSPSCGAPLSAGTPRE